MKVVWLLIAVLLSAPGYADSQERANDTLLVENRETGTIVCGIATRLEILGDGVRIELPDSLSADDVQGLLKQKFADWKIEVDSKAVVISDIAKQKIKRRLVAISVAHLLAKPREPDVLQDLAQMVDPMVATVLPEANGSIRASRGAPSGEPEPENTGSDRSDNRVLIGEHDHRERWVGQVIYIERMEFPQVRIKVRVRVPPWAGKHRAEFRKHRVLKLQVLYPSINGQIDFKDPATHRNLLGYYLSPGDRVVFHALAPREDGIVVDWLERRSTARMRYKN